MPSSTQDARVRRLRRVYRRAGYQVWKVRENDRWYQEFGPFSLIDSATNSIVDKGLTLAELEQSADEA